MKTKENVIDMLETMMGCQTAAYIANDNGNESYSVVNVDDLIDEDGVNIQSENWNMTSCEEATQKNVDMEIWAQEFDDNNKMALVNTMEAGELYVASFENENGCLIKLLVW